MPWHRTVQVDRYTYNCIVAVPCPEPYCRSAKDWPCSTRTGNWSGTAHASRWAAFREWIDAQDK